MAMTKRIRVSFDLKLVYSTEHIEAMKANLVALSRSFMEGEKLSGLHMELARVAAEYGPEAALELALKKSIKEGLVEDVADNNFNVSNFRFEVKR